MKRLKVIDGGNDKSGFRHLDGTAEYWRCPICEHNGDGQHMAVIEIYPFIELKKGGKIRKPEKVLACANCYLKHDRITEV